MWKHGQRGHLINCHCDNQAVVTVLTSRTSHLQHLMHLLRSLHFFNPLTTNDDYSCHRNSATRYQLAQSVLKIGSALAERAGQGEVGGSTALADRAWWLLQLAIERAWPALDGPFFCLLVQTSAENGPFTL